MSFIYSLLIGALFYLASSVNIAMGASATTYFPSVKAPLVSQSLLLDIINVGQVKLVAVGEHGHIIISTDGKNWHQSEVPVQSTLTNVFFYNENLAWAVGHDSTILHSQDGGLNWQVQMYKPALEKPLFNIVFKNPREGIAIGAHGLFFRTIDGGTSWQSEFHSEFLMPNQIEYLAKLKIEDEEAYLDEITTILPHFNRLMLDGRTLYLVGGLGIIAKSNDFGKSWQPLESIYNGSFFDIIRTLKSNLLVAGLSGHVFRSSKSGGPWKQSRTNITELINDIVLTNEGHIYLLANNGTLLESLDDGQSYRLIIQKSGKTLIAGVWFDNKLIVVTDVGVQTISL